MHRCISRRCFSSSDSITNCGNRDDTLRSGFSSALEADCRLSRTANYGDKFSENRRLVVGTETTALSNISLSPSRLKYFLARRARVRDDPGRSPQIELEPERSFDGPLSGTQNVCRMTRSRNRTGSRAWSKSSAHRPPAHADAAAGADSKDPEVRSAVQADESLTKSAFPKVEVLYVVMGCSETSVLSTRRRRGAKPLSCCGSSI